MFRRILLYFYNRGSINSIANALQHDGKKNRILFPYCSSTWGQTSKQGRTFRQICQQLFNHNGMGYIDREWYIDDTIGLKGTVRRLEKKIKKLEEIVKDYQWEILNKTIKGE